MRWWIGAIVLAMLVAGCGRESEATLALNDENGTEAPLASLETLNEDGEAGEESSDAPSNDDANGENGTEAPTTAAANTTSSPSGQPAAATGTGNQRSFTLRLREPAGTTYANRVEVNMTLNIPADAELPPGVNRSEMDGSAKIVTRANVKVVSVNNGNHTIEVNSTVENAEATGFLQQILPMFQQQFTEPQRFVMNDRAGMVEEGGGSVQLQQGGLTFPEGPIRVGQSWSESMDMGGGMSLTVNYRFTAIEQVKGRETVRIEADIVPPEGAQGSQKFTYWIDHTNGRLIRMTAELTEAGMPGKVTIRQEII